MFTKIGVPLDGSDLAEKALPYALKLAKTFGAELLLLRVAELPTFTTDTADHELAVLKQAESYLAAVKLALTDPELEEALLLEQVQTLVAYGKRVSEITEIAPFEKVDLIVMTTHARTGLPRLVLGSVATSVLQKAHLPVLLINPEKTVATADLEDAMVYLIQFNPVAGVSPIVVTLDGSPESEAIIGSAEAMSRQLGLPLHLLQVVTPYVPIEYGEVVMSYGYDLDKETEVRVKEAEAYLDKLVAKLTSQGICCLKEVRVGSAATEIIQYAKAVQAPMLAMATHARGSVGHFFMGSVADEVLHQTHLPVLMVHTAPKQVTVKTTEEAKVAVMTK